jgi:hypothetical protein
MSASDSLCKGVEAWADDGWLQFGAAKLAGTTGAVRNDVFGDKADNHDDHGLF